MPNWASRTRRLGGGLTAALAVTLAGAGAAHAGITPVDQIGRSVVDSDIRAPHAVVTTPDGSIYAAEFGTYTPLPGEEATARRRVLKYTPDGAGGYTRSVVVGTAGGAACPEGAPGSACGDGGPATSAPLGRLSGLAVDAQGRIYIAESFWYRVRVVGTDGIIRTVEGVPGGHLNVPEGLAYDARTDAVLVTDKRNHRLLSFKATNATSPAAWTTVAGTGRACADPATPCGDGGNASAAQLTLPGAVAADGRGTIYVADSGAHRVRRISGGRIFRFAGTGVPCDKGQACGDGGPAVDASLGRAPEIPGESDGEGPFGVATTPNGVVYIGDSDIDRVRRVLPDGRIQTVMDVEHPKALFALATPTGHDIVVPEWDNDVLSRLTGVDTDAARQPLTVVRAGTGSGTVTGTGIACGSDCAETVDFGTQVTLTAAAATGSTFTGWSGACEGTGPCTVTVDAARTATATFTKDTPPPARRLTASVTGSGTVTGAGLACGSTCSATQPDGTPVTLTAAPAAGQRFVRWTGACSAATTATCELTMSADQAVGAVFEAVPVVTPPPTEPPVVTPPVVQPPPAAALSLKGSVLGSRTVRLGRPVRLRYTLTARAALSLEVRHVRGGVQRIALGTRPAGSGTVTWSGRLHGRRVAGRYTLVLVAKAGSVTRRTSLKVTVRR